MKHKYYFLFLMILFTLSCEIDESFLHEDQFRARMSIPELLHDDFIIQASIEEAWIFEQKLQKN